MKLQFSADLPYQAEAVRAVCDLFEGQQTCQTLFTVTRERTAQAPLLVHDTNAARYVSAALAGDNDLGIGNRLKLDGEDLLKNLQKVQLRNGLAPSPSLPTRDFTVEMETGTGKTYVYLRTIFELATAATGFTKFIIVVPSIAIKEGVYKNPSRSRPTTSAASTQRALRLLRLRLQARSTVRNFATSDCIQIMVINIDAFRKSFDRTPRQGGQGQHHPPAARPHDGPRSRSTSSGHAAHRHHRRAAERGHDRQEQEAIASLNPLCTLRYSATHRDKHNLVYRLDAVDAYERKLVKQIEVASASTQGGHNRAFPARGVRRQQKGPHVPGSSCDIHVQRADGHQAQSWKVKHGTDLYELGGRDVYRWLRRQRHQR
jgi:type III restriction enzyme